ncbi:MAG TPA: hypothetical protein VFS48_01845 [Solirubrobacterales bacterium]|nr:hypothetical protein [Solirubrobacterales bacterium]
MQRRCFDSRGRGWDEVCTLWEEGHRYSMRVRTETYPFALRQMFRRFSGTWEVEPFMSVARQLARGDRVTVPGPRPFDQVTGAPPGLTTSQRPPNSLTF